MTLLRCEVRHCTAVTDSAQQGLIAGDGWRIERVGDTFIVVCPAHNWRSNGQLVAVAG
jgi:hypothetical protein